MTRKETMFKQIQREKKEKIERLDGSCELCDDPGPNHICKDCGGDFCEYCIVDHVVMCRV